MNRKTPPPQFNANALWPRSASGEPSPKYDTNQTVFQQGDAADAVLYIHFGKVKLTVVSEQGKEAVIALLSGRDFFGEGA